MVKSISKSYTIPKFGWHGDDCSELLEKKQRDHPSSLVYQILIFNKSAIFLLVLKIIWKRPLRN